MNTKIIIVIKGGSLQAIYSNTEVTAAVVDYDNIGQGGEVEIGGQDNIFIDGTGGNLIDHKPTADELNRIKF